ncbi:hypothetical protein EIN_440400 [Entamoeba invadens IP1]|uniref:Uncharacterized protein n=1 Tax=Entamoeba invadens IP1 TaxID=370355 RepID=A0A0A1TUW6_ENTIV|nr:hypothetical protein EIN_440400 [Entamoeba invadens IP1]ELP83896.1 hypothetical protein EIN_440400 [Entamoeba invadens IP1]|eukprot:XP_004183242.1 hypothetical protein EIN_440400 [Entamoeba invadens IP1]
MVLLKKGNKCFEQKKNEIEKEGTLTEVQEAKEKAIKTHKKVCNDRAIQVISNSSWRYNTIKSAITNNDWQNYESNLNFVRMNLDQPLVKETNVTILSLKDEILRINPNLAEFVNFYYTTNHDETIEKLKKESDFVKENTELERKIGFLIRANTYYESLDEDLQNIKTFIETHQEQYTKKGINFEENIKTCESNINTILAMKVFSSVFYGVRGKIDTLRRNLDNKESNLENDLKSIEDDLNRVVVSSHPNSSLLIMRSEIEETEPQFKRYYQMYEEIKKEMQENKMVEVSMKQQPNVGTPQVNYSQPQKVVQMPTVIPQKPFVQQSKPVIQNTQHTVQATQTNVQSINKQSDLSKQSAQQRVIQTTQTTEIKSEDVNKVTQLRTQIKKLVEQITTNIDKIKSQNKCSNVTQQEYQDIPQLLLKVSLKLDEVNKIEKTTADQNVKVICSSIKTEDLKSIQSDLDEVRSGKLND